MERKALCLSVLSVLYVTLTAASDGAVSTLHGAPLTDRLVVSAFLLIVGAGVLFIINLVVVAAIKRGMSTVLNWTPEQPVLKKRILAVSIVSPLFYYMGLLAVETLASRHVDELVFYLGPGFMILLVAPTAYLLLFKDVYGHKPAMYASIAFGVLSNPMWIGVLFWIGVWIGIM